MPKKTVTLEFELRSLDSNQRVSRAFAEVRRAAPELQAKLATKYPGARVAIKRSREFPGALEVWHFVVEIATDPAVIAGLKTGAASFFASQTLMWIKSKVVGRAAARPALAKHDPTAEQTRPKTKRRSGPASKGKGSK